MRFKAYEKKLNTKRIASRDLILTNCSMMKGVNK
jgi:hypothetical protein